MKRTSFLALSTVALVLVFALAAPAQTVNCSGVAAWSPNSVSYSVGALVTYNGSEYKCIQAHTSQPGWDPADVPALWSLVGTCGTTSATPTATATPKATATATATSQPTVNPTATPKPTATATATASSSGGTCWPAWVSTTAYNGGAQVSYSGVNYQAAYWTQGNVPSTNSGPAGSGQPWIPEGSCSGGSGGTSPTPTATPKPTATATASSGGSGGGAAAGFIFSDYKDVTVDANWNTGAQQTTVGGTSSPVASVMPNKTETWAFATGDCTSENWAGISPAMESTNVQAFVSAGKDYILSTGGAAGSFTCSSGSGLVGFINRYASSNLLGVDFDIETGQTQATIDGLVASVQGAQASFPNLRFSFTVAAFGSTSAPDIFNSTGDAVVNSIKSHGLGGNWTINPMSFDFGSANPSVCVVVNGACEMGQSAIATMQAVNQQKGISNGHIEVTLEIPTDDGGAPFTSGDVSTVCSWIKSNGIAGIHFWSLDRDTGFTYSRSIPSACGTN